MELTNIKYIRDTHEVILYFKDYCIKAPATWQTYNLYAEFHNFATYTSEVLAIDVKTIKWDNTFSELIAL
jgi:hypothetical protein